MGSIAEAFQALRNRAAPPIPAWESGRAVPMSANYDGYMRKGFNSNGLVHSCIQMLATSAAEPGLRVRYGSQWRLDHPLIRLLDHPNPLQTRFDLFASVIVHRALAGNAYGLIIENNIGRPMQLWLLRPDRVSVVPSATTGIDHYEYDVGGVEKVRLPVESVVHWKTLSADSPYYGWPQIASVAGYVDIDNFMVGFVSAYFDHAGVPGGLLSVKQKLSPDQLEQLRNRFRQFGGPTGWHELLILDANESTFTPMTSQLGTAGLVLPELNEIVESRICAAFGVPMSLVGTLAGAGNSSYGNKKSERESFWNETLKPLYRELEGPINMKLVPRFQGIDQLEFDLSTVGALQADIDAHHDRLRKDVAAGVLSIEEFRERAGYGPLMADGTYLVPSNLVPTMGRDLDEVPPPSVPAVLSSPNGNGVNKVPAGV